MDPEKGRIFLVAGSFSFGAFAPILLSHIQQCKHRVSSVSKQRQECGTFFLNVIKAAFLQSRKSRYTEVFSNCLWQHLATGAWHLQSACHPGFPARPSTQSHRRVENREQNQLFSSKMPSTVCGAGGLGRHAGGGETTHAGGSQACRIFAATSFPLFSRKFLIPLFCHPQHRTGCSPHSLLLLHAGSSGSFASALSASFLRTCTLVWLCLLKGATFPPSWHYLSGILEVLHSALKPFHIVFLFTAFSLSAKNS